MVRAGPGGARRMDQMASGLANQVPMQVHLHFPETIMQSHLS